MTKMRVARRTLLRKVSLGRTGTFLLLTLLLGTVLYFRWASPPFSAVASKSMEPAFTLGDLILVEKVVPAEVKEGDVIVFEVPGPIRERYNYPPSIAHRVIEVDASERGLFFRTKGDNTGEDPFTVFPGDIKGKVRSTIPHVGYLPLFLQSKQGLAFLAAAAIICLVYSFSGEIESSGKSLNKAVSSTLAREFVVHVEELERRQEHTSEMVAQALEQFAGAMGEYSKHLQSHTSAVKDLASASQELRESVRERGQTGVFSQGRGVVRPQETRTRTVKPIPGCYRTGRNAASHPQDTSQSPPGCYKRLKS